MVDEWSELDDYQSAQGAQFRLAAEALAAGASREAVRVAYNGFGSNIVPDLHKLRLNHGVVVAMRQRASRGMTAKGLSVERANENLIKRTRESRDAIEGEWGHTEGQVGAEKWVRLDLPIVKVSPPEQTESD